MTDPISRRKMLGITAGAAATAFTGSDWIFTLTDSGRIVRAAGKDGAAAWKPVFLTKKEAEQVAAVCEAIIPRTDTAGARDARVHEYIDLALSVEGPARRKSFREGLKWLDRHCEETTGTKLRNATQDQLRAALAPLSDEHESHAEELKTGAAFFRDVKSRTIFGYYTSVEGRVQELGKLAEVSMEVFQGCTHDTGAHQALPGS